MGTQERKLVNPMCKDRLEGESEGGLRGNAGRNGRSMELPSIRRYREKRCMIRPESVY